MKLGFLFAALLLAAGCSGQRVVIQKVPVEKKVFEKVAVPATYLQVCPFPDLDVETNEELEAAFTEALVSLAQCNEDKASIRDWKE